MSRARTRADEVWYCEGSDTDAVNYLPMIREKLPGRRVTRFQDYEEVTTAIADARRTGEFPWLVISDRVALIAPEGQRTPAEVLRAESPATALQLFSRSVYMKNRAKELLEHWKPVFAADEPVDIDDGADPSEQLRGLWLRHHYVIGVRRKVEEAKMKSDLADLDERWARPTLARFRRYLFEECRDPGAKHFAADAGSIYLSAYDLHSEMLRGSELGLEQERIWSEILEPGPGLSAVAP